MGVAQLQSVARGMLEGVGDAQTFEHGEWSGKAYHLRRRLAPAEEGRIGPAEDIRGTEEARRRVAAARLAAPHIPFEYFQGEIEI